MSYEPRSIIEGMLASVEYVLSAIAPLSPREFKRNREVQWRIAKAIVTLGRGWEQLPHELWMKYRDPWWGRCMELRYGLEHGYSQLSPKFLWRTVPQEWPRLEAQLRQMLAEMR